MGRVPPKQENFGRRFFSLVKMKSIREANLNGLIQKDKLKNVVRDIRSEEKEEKNPESFFSSSEGWCSRLRERTKKKRKSEKEQLGTG